MVICVYCRLLYSPKCENFRAQFWTRLRQTKTWERLPWVRKKTGWHNIGFISSPKSRIWLLGHYSICKTDSHTFHCGSSLSSPWWDLPSITEAFYFSCWKWSLVLCTYLGHNFYYDESHFVSIPRGQASFRWWGVHKNDWQICKGCRSWSCPLETISWIPETVGW